MQHKIISDEYTLVIKLSAFVIIFFLKCSPALSLTPADYVNIFLGTAGDHGQLSPAATVPFGMVKLGPDTYPDALNGKAHAGYNYENTKISGFSHIRIEGTGCTGVGGNIAIMPVLGNCPIKPGAYCADYNKNTERASPGYYTVSLGNPAIHVELTAAYHTGVHSYRFPKSKSAHILIDLSRTFTDVYNAQCIVIGDDEIAGFVTARQICTRQDTYTLFFSARFSKPFKSFTTWNGEKIAAGERQQRGENIGIVIDYSTAENETIIVKIGLSPVGIEQARKDRDLEVPGWNFESVKNEANKKWNALLSKIQVEGNEEYKTLFYTLLYRTYLLPVNATSTSGTFMGTDSLLHKTEGYTHYDSYTLWDDYRTKYPLLSIVEPGILLDVVRSLTAIYRQGKKYTPLATVRMEHTIPVIVDAFQKGLRDFDVQSAYQGMRRDALEQIPDSLEHIGYVPERPDQTLEFSYDDWAVAQMANALGNKNDYQKFAKRAQFYKNTWDSTLTFFRARDRQGTWLTFPDPEVIDETYVYEGSMWQWRWFVLHDVNGLINLMGGKNKFIRQLEYFFEHDLYNHGNQPDLNAVYLFNYAGAPYLTQKYVKKILTQPIVQRYGTHKFFKKPINDRIYKNTPDGYLLEMDDDGGTLCSWFVLSAMGIYPVCVGNPIYQIGAPIFEKVIINLDNNFYKGKQFIIRAENISEQNIYIQSATLNGENYNRTSLRHNQIVSGGELIFKMGPESNKKWGR